MTDSSNKKRGKPCDIGGGTVVSPDATGDVMTVPTLDDQTIQIPTEVFAVITGARRNAPPIIHSSGDVTSGDVTSGDITDKVRATDPDASASDVLDVLSRTAELPHEEAEVVARTGGFDVIDEEPPRGTWEYENLHAGKKVRLLICWDKAMKPSDSTQLLVRHMRIKPGEEVLDLGTGTGVIGVAAHKLGAGHIVSTDVHSEFQPEINVNLRMNGLSTEERESIHIRFGDLFEPVLGKFFNHVIINPPSIACPSGEHLSPAYDSGPEGRDVMDRIIREASLVLPSGGRLTIVHSSLANLPKSIGMLQERGFVDIEMSEPEEFEFKDFYPVEHLKRLKTEGKAKFREEKQPDGGIKYFETCRVVTAVRQDTKQ